MPRIVAVLGLCGSGKSVLADKLDAEGLKKLDEGVRPGLHNWKPFLAALGEGLDCVVVEIALFDPNVRAWLAAMLEAFPGYVVEYRCFENDRKTADENCRKDLSRGIRTAERCAGNLDQNARTITAFQAGAYSFPDGAEILRITPA